MNADAALMANVRERLPKGARVLDVPAGNGNLSQKLTDAGYHVVSSDLLCNRYLGDGAGMVKSDMTAGLPIATDSLDGLVCQEGIEHLEDPAIFLRECRRTLRDGGHLWLTTPNVMDLSSRLSHFLTGMKSLRSGFPNEAQTVRAHLPASGYVHGHAFTLPFFQIRYLLRIQQFDEIELAGIGRSGTSTALSWVLRPATAWLVRRALRRQQPKMVHGVKRRAPREVARELQRFATSRDLLCFRKILIRARLDEGSFEISPEAALD